MNAESGNSIYDISAIRLDGTTESLSAYRGYVMLIVNVASRCAFTSQYQALQDIYDKFREQRFVVLGFPCNQFGGQEPLDDTQIKEFCSTSYNITFPLFAKIDVNGPQAHPLFELLKSERTGILGTKAIKWNFTKFLVSRVGVVIARFSPTTTPASLEQDILKQLAQ